MKTVMEKERNKLYEKKRKTLIRQTTSEWEFLLSDIAQLVNQVED